LQVNLNALAHNVKEYQKILEPQTQIMAMVKAFAYGSGGAEIASVLQQQHVHYLGVAYADEGVELRKANISLPVMVMNAEESSFAAIVDNNLQPVLFSFALFQQFENYISSQALQHYPVHIEIETGMNRLGFAVDDVQQLAEQLSNNSLLQVQSVFTHLAASDDAQQDDYTNRQATTFNKAISVLEKELPYIFLRHIANSAAAVRHPNLQMSMVRLGIGLYGIEMDTKNLLQLQPVATLRSTIAQIKRVDAGSSVSYNRSGVVHRPSIIATVRIGYADGYSRRFGNGVGKMLVNKKLVPVIGAVCMDMAMIDVTDIPNVQEGDEVIVFGEGLPIQEIAEWINTIPYEIMTSVSARVKRVYFSE
ncbi:MAG: alanine racemase, partial [Bacteroidota bacterium]